MQIDDPRDGFFYPTLTLIMNSYFLAQDKIKVQCDLSGMRENLTLSQTMRIYSCTTVKIFGSNNFSAQFIKIISHYKKIGYNINVLQQTACLVVNPITVGNFAFLFNCTPVGRTSDSMIVPT